MAYCSLEFQRSPRNMSFNSYIWDLGKGKRKPPPSVTLPLRKHFVPSKSVMKPRSTPEGAEGDWFPLCPQINAEEGRNGA